MTTPDPVQALVAVLHDRAHVAEQIPEYSSCDPSILRDAAALITTLAQARTEAEQKLADAAMEINCAGPVAHRIQVLKLEHADALATALRERDTRAECLVEAEAEALRLKHYANSLNNRLYALECERDTAQWQPIETAPKDEGHMILLARGVLLCLGYWYRRDWYFLSHPLPERFQDPTHWMPLPDPPRAIQPTPTETP